MKTPTNQVSLKPSNQLKNIVKYALELKLYFNEIPLNIARDSTGFSQIELFLHSNLLRIYTSCGFATSLQ